MVWAGPSQAKPTWRQLSPHPAYTVCVSPSGYTTKSLVRISPGQNITGALLCHLKPYTHLANQTGNRHSLTRPTAYGRKPGGRGPRAESRELVGCRGRGESHSAAGSELGPKEKRSTWEKELFYGVHCSLRKPQGEHCTSAVARPLKKSHGAQVL